MVKKGITLIGVQSAERNGKQLNWLDNAWLIHTKIGNAEVMVIDQHNKNKFIDRPAYFLWYTSVKYTTYWALNIYAFI